MGKIIAVANQKGGVGKTTTCVNLTCALKKRGRRVLLVDCDPQGNSTSGMGVDKTATPNCYDMLMNGAAAADCIRSTKYGDVLPANMNLSGCSVELVGSEQREYIMKTALAAVQGDYDFILIDCPPSLELLTINALVAAGSFFVYNMKYEPVILCLLYCFISSKVGDIMLRGFKEAIKFEVVTDRPEALEEAILQSMGHGVTEIRAVGGYTHEKKTMLICVINKHQIVQFQRLLKQYPGSFAYLSSVKETVGNFRNIH